ncbi:MAG: sel1 repeat family protein [Deltaproteobacteria bacterium]|nr:sel1 repeat family protein [Deltaproteobacteria bacterium]
MGHGPAARMWRWSILAAAIAPCAASLAGCPAPPGSGLRAAASQSPPAISPVAPASHSSPASASPGAPSAPIASITPSAASSASAPYVEPPSSGCPRGTWRPKGSSGPCQSDPDAGPRTCGHSANFQRGVHCCCSPSDLLCQMACAESARWNTPAPAPELADCRTKCKAGRGWACLKSALSQVEGSPSPKQRTEAMKTFERACELGADAGCRQLAERHDTEDLGTASPATAQWASVRCPENAIHEHPCRLAGVVHERGWGTVANAAEAKRYYDRSCDIATRRCKSDQRSCAFANRVCAQAAQLAAAAH